MNSGRNTVAGSNQTTDYSFLTSWDNETGSDFGGSSENYTERRTSGSSERTTQRVSQTSRRQGTGSEGSGYRAAPRNQATQSNRASQRNRSSNRRRRRRDGSDAIKVIIAVIIAALILVGGFFLIKSLIGKFSPEKEKETVTVEETTDVVIETEESTEAATAAVIDVLEKAKLKAAQYDYDGALELINNEKDIQDLPEVKEFIAEVNATKETLVRFPVSDVTHIFFHILTVDPDLTFDASKWGNQAGGYNSLMTTIPEFERILESMYARGYVLISLHDMGKVEQQADGTYKMVQGNIMLPPGKKAFVMSEDDVCYYEYMKGAGFADKMIIGEDGRPTLHYVDREGNEHVGDYDIVPILDKFIDEHPDFSYHGHKACLVFTGYNGVLGYRTDETYLPENYEKHKVEGGHDVEAERKEAVKVLRALYEDGYDLGSHSWGHRDMGAMSVSFLKEDSDKWERNVNSLIREATGQGADILIYPKGADIGDWRGYDSKDQKKEGCVDKYKYLTDLGFRYFCNVDSSKTWVQVGSDYIRTGRRALDGYNFWFEIQNNKGRFTDLWDNTSAIFDSRRPTPVPSY
ncbi:MAG: polysaccharide deacetylase [Eubacteriales bacterium]|nr:polysaccharide deacetylase [Eubacteriales bacterium]